MTSAADIKEFFGHDKIAVIGASRNGRKYGHALFKEMIKQGFKAVPVNPHAPDIDGYKAYAGVGQIPGGVLAAIAVVPPSAQEQVAQECVKAGVKMLWMHESISKGVSNAAAVTLAEQGGVKVITGYCPMMFMPEPGLPHGIHRFFLNLFGALPK